MGRLIILLIVALGIAFAVTSLMALARSPASPTKETDMPDSVKTVAYVLLVALMLGIATGVIGGL